MDNGCVEWIGCRDKNGYGRVNRPGDGNGVILAHRAAYELARGPIPAKMNVLHKCDNPKCINVDHLFLGTLADNSADMVSKGRSCRGSRRPDAKLSEDKIIGIRTRYAAGGITMQSLATEFGVGLTTVHHIIARNTWKHI